MQKNLTNRQAGLAGFALAFLVTFIVAGTIACSEEKKTKADDVNYTSNVPQIIEHVTTRQAGVEESKAADVSAGGLVQSADSKVVAVNKDHPDARLVGDGSAHADLAKANLLLQDNVDRDQKIIDSLLQDKKDLQDHAKADAALLAQAKQLAVDKAAEHDRADKAEGFIEEHKNDVWGAWTHRVVHAISWTLIITLAVLLLAVGIMGSIYGLPKIVSPAMGIAGKLEQGVLFVMYHAATAIWACVPVFGHWIDEALNSLGLFKKTASIQQVVVPHPTSQTAGV